MVLVYLPFDALLQHLLSYLGFSYLGHGVCLHSCSSKAQPLFLTLDEGYLLTTTPPDLEHGVAPLGPPAPAQPPLLGHGVVTLGYHPWPQMWGSSSWPPPLLGWGAPGFCLWPRTWDTSSRPRLCTIAATCACVPLQINYMPMHCLVCFI